MTKHIFVNFNFIQRLKWLKRLDIFTKSQLYRCVQAFALSCLCMKREICLSLRGDDTKVSFDLHPYDSQQARVRGLCASF